MSDKTYQSSDLAEVAVLLYFNHYILSVDRSQRRAMFTLTKTDETEDIVNEYKTRVLAVEPAAYFRALKEAKDLLYSN
jgi:hypothetical protein